VELATVTVTHTDMVREGRRALVATLQGLAETLGLTLQSRAEHIVVDVNDAATDTSAVAPAPPLSASPLSDTGEASAATGTEPRIHIAAPPEKAQKSRKSSLEQTYGIQVAASEEGETPTASSRSGQPLSMSLPTSKSSYSKTLTDTSKSKTSTLSSPAESRALEGYEVLSTLNGGSHAVCRLLRDRLSGKVFLCKIPREKRDVEDVMREAYLLGLVHHPNIIDLEETIIVDSSMVLVLEFAEYGDLMALQRQPAVSGVGRLAMHALLQISMALAHLHRNYIAHRDIKPANIVLNRFGIFKLIDFGVSRILVGTTQTLTGTPLFMAPEILEGKPYTRESDVYSLGCTIYYLCTGQTPHMTNDLPTLKSILASRSTGVIGYKPLDPAHFPAELIKAVDAMLATNIEARPSAAQVADMPWLATFCHADHVDFVSALRAID